VLKGAERLLREVRPSVYIEVDEASAGEVYALFTGHGYGAIDPTNDQPISCCIENTLFVPHG
jgi:hypothetical protein